MDALRLSIINTREGGEAHAIDIHAERTLLGRARDCDLQLPFQAVSSRHLVIVRHEGSYHVADVGSTNGTLHGGQRLLPKQYLAIYAGMVLQIAHLRLEFQPISMDRVGAGFTLAESTTMVREMVVEALSQQQADDLPYMEIQRGPGAGRRLVIAEEVDEGWIGNSLEAAVRLDVPGLPAHVAQLKRVGDGYSIDKGSDLGEEVVLTLNTTPVVSLRPLLNGDRLVIGPVELLYCDPLEAYLAELDLIDEPGAHHVTTLPQGAEAVPEEDALDTPAATPAATPVAPAAASVSATSQTAPPSEEEAPGRETKRGLGATEIALIALSVLMLLVGVGLMVYIFTSS